MKSVVPKIDTKRIINPVMWFSNSARSAKFFMFTSGILLILLFIQPVALEIVRNQKTNVVVMDQFSYYVAPMMNELDSDQMFNAISSQAVEAYLDRNPEGFDKKMLLKQIFINPAYDYALKDFEKYSEEFSKKKIHQKVEIDKIIIQSATSENIVTVVKGQLIQTGVDDNVSYQQGYEFIMKLLMVKNPSLGNGRLPYCVWKCMYKLRKIKEKNV